MVGGPWTRSDRSASGPDWAASLDVEMMVGPDTGRALAGGGTNADGANVDDPGPLEALSAAGDSPEGGNMEGGA